MNAHTPGPWTIAPGQFIVADVRNGDPTTGLIVAEVPCQGANPADLPLIAEAPALLAALRDLREACADAYKAGRIPAEPFVRAGNVIANAEGGAR